jgi:hypothetical protein
MKPCDQEASLDRDIIYGRLVFRLVDELVLFDPRHFEALKKAALRLLFSFGGQRA